MSYRRVITDARIYRGRLERFLTDKCLLFNPYTVSDERLWAGIMKMRWRGIFSLTQMVVLNFVEIRTVGTGLNAYENVVFRIGDSTEEIVCRLTKFTYSNTAADSLRPIRSSLNGRPVTQPKQIRPLMGKSVFVSRNITTVNARFTYSVAMAMHRLKGKLAEDAVTIRTAIMNSKIEMLDRLLEYPHTHIYLNGEPSEPVDIVTPINRVKALIATYPTVTPPRN